MNTSILRGISWTLAVALHGDYAFVCVGSAGIEVVEACTLVLLQTDQF